MEVEEMTKEEQMQKNVEEFARLQRYMILAEKDSETYKAMKGRYIELKVILTTSGVNIAELEKNPAHYLKVISEQFLIF